MCAKAVRVIQEFIYVTIQSFKFKSCSFTSQSCLKASKYGILTLVLLFCQCMRKCQEEKKREGGTYTVPEIITCYGLREIG